jgi:hypothetical protein
MPRKSRPQSLLASLKQQGAKALAALRQEITRREQELGVLKTEEERWKEVVGAQPRATTAASTSTQKPATTKRARLDWDAVLSQLPATFTAQEVEQKTRKPMGQVYAGLSRWVEDRKVRKNPNGKYQKISAPLPSLQKETNGQAKKKPAA